jgi:hypothetical protein
VKSSKAACAIVVYLLRSVNGLRILRVSAVAALIAFPGFLLAPGVVWRLVRLAVLGLLRAGWYTIPKARLFDEFEGSSGTAVALSDLGDLAIRLVPLGIGLSRSEWVSARRCGWASRRRYRCSSSCRRLPATDECAVTRLSAVARCSGHLPIAPGVTMRSAASDAAHAVQDLLVCRERPRKR